MNNYTEFPICVECKHCITKDKSIPECALTAIGRDIVTGEYLSPLSCHSARRGNCGHLGSHFESKLENLNWRAFEKSLGDSK